MNKSNPQKEIIKIYSKQLRMPSFNSFEEVIRQMEPNESYEHFLSRLMKREVSIRQENVQKRRLKAAKFPFVKSLDEFDFKRLEHVSQSHIQELASCDYIEKKQNIIMIGNPGSGKTHLSLALGLRACYSGYNVRFYTASHLAHELTEALELKRFSKFEKTLSKIDLLILDELSYLTFNRHQSELLFQVISERSERASIIVSTNLEFSNWTQIFDNDIMLAALIDRLTFKSHILDMNVKDSYRLLQTKLGGKG